MLRVRTIRSGALASCSWGERYRPGGPLLPAGFVDGDGGGDGDVERADPAELGDEADGVAGGEGGRGEAVVLVADGEADGRGREVELVERRGVVGELDADDAPAGGLGCGDALGARCRRRSR